MAHDRQLPSFLAKAYPEHGVPVTATFVTAVVSLVPHVSVVVHHLVRKTAFVWLGSGLTILLSVMATGRRADLWAIDAPEGSYR